MKSASRRGPAHSRAGTTPAAPSPGQAQHRPETSSSLNELREEYRRLFHSEAPRLSRDLLVRAIGYRRQEIEHGGLGNATRRKLQTIAKALRVDRSGWSDPKSQPEARSTPGARMARPHPHRHRDGRRI